MNDFPEKWICEVNDKQDKIMTAWCCDFHNKKRMVYCGDSILFYNESGEYYFELEGDNGKATGRTKITFDQFEKYVLNKEPFIVKKENINYLIKLFKKYNIK